MIQRISIAKTKWLIMLNEITVVYCADEVQISLTSRLIAHVVNNGLYSLRKTKHQEEGGDVRVHLSK